MFFKYEMHGIYIQHKFKILFFAVFILNSCYAQDFPNCQLLSTLVQNEKAQQTFKFSKYKDVPIIFIDSKGLFKECNIPVFYDRNVIISNDTSRVSEINASNIIIYSLRKKRGKYDIEIQQKFTGAYGHIEFKKSKSGFAVSKFDVGYF